TTATELNEERRSARQFIIDSWQKALRNEKLTAIEQQIVEIISYHPEYHTLLGSNAAIDYQGEDNPFLHLSLHLTLNEQLSINQPEGIRARYQSLSEKLGDAHNAAHQIIECLNITLQSAFERGIEPSPEDYLATIDQILARLG
ncbi:MAG: DUF1841 family protein, partial [Pseudomonadota bacterium]|nr:DUF1841 family protein [Pseudomonadota bacterium]